MEIIYILGAIVAICILLPAILGLFLKKDHTATRSALYHSSAEQIWDLISDINAQKIWRKDLKRIEALRSHNGHPAWKEVSRNGQSLQLAITESVPVKKLVRTIINSRSFGGNWVIELDPETSGTAVRITENGFINNPGMRFIFRFFLSSTSGIDKYLQMLGTHLGQKVEPK